VCWCAFHNDNAVVLFRKVDGFLHFSASEYHGQQAFRVLLDAA
jgi:hypothetical protein